MGETRDTGLIPGSGRFPWRIFPWNIHFCIPAWEIPWIEETGGFSPLGHKESDMTEHALRTRRSMKQLLPCSHSSWDTHFTEAPLTLHIHLIQKLHLIYKQTYVKGINFSISSLAERLNTVLGFFVVLLSFNLSPMNELSEYCILKSCKIILWVVMSSTLYTVHLFLFLVFRDWLVF